MKIKGFDIDGVIHLGNLGRGVIPGANDVIITGRSFEEEPETLSFLRKNGIHNIVFFNKLKFANKARKSSGIHKANTINALKNMGIEIEVFFEDDPVQMNEISTRCPCVRVVHLNHNLVERENVRHTEDA